MNAIGDALEIAPVAAKRVSHAIKPVVTKGPGSHPSGDALVKHSRMLGHLTRSALHLRT